MTGAAPQVFAHAPGEISPPVHESQRFDGSASSHDVEPFFFRDSCTGEDADRATPVRATAVAGAVLFTDMLLEGLAIPVLPLLPSVVEQGEAATGILFSSYAAAMIVATLFTGRVDRKSNV